MRTVFLFINKNDTDIFIIFKLLRTLFPYNVLILRTFLVNFLKQPEEICHSLKHVLNFPSTS